MTRALAAGLAFATVGALPAKAESNAGQMFGRVLDLYKDLKAESRRRKERQDVGQAQAGETIKESSAYKIGDFRLGDRATASALRDYACKPSDQFAGSTWCVRSSRVREARGEFTLSESLLVSIEGKLTYINRLYAPAFFTANEINKDIARKSKQLGEAPRIQRSPRSAGLPDGMLAVWGHVTLEPLEDQALQLVAQEQSPNAAFIMDLLNDPALSARSGLPVYRIGGDGPGYVWAVAVGPNGVGRLRFLAIDPRQASLREVVSEESKTPAAPPISKNGSSSDADEQRGPAGAASKLADDKGDERLPLSDPRSFNAKSNSSYGVDPAPLTKGCREPETGQTFDCLPDDPNNPLKKLRTGACVRELTGRREDCPADPAWHQRQDERLAAEDAVRQAEDAKRLADLQAARAKRDPSDVVEQVLNYTVTGSDQGTPNNFWFKSDPAQKCVYERVTGTDETNDKLVDVLNLFAAILPRAIDVKSIDFNKLDFTGLSVDYAPRLESVVVAHDGKPLLLLHPRADIERVKRGWNLIYEEGHCKGLKRAF